MASVHVYPPDDVVEHDTEDTDTDCWCGPRTEFSEGDEGSGWVIIHNSIDGREFTDYDGATMPSETVTLEIPSSHRCDECGKTWGSPNAADACCSDTYDRGRE